MTGERDNPTGDITHEANVEVELARLGEQLRALRNEMILTRNADQEAVKTALISQKELAQKHNDLIHSMEKRDAEYLSIKDYESRHDALKERLSRTEAFQSKLTGGFAVLAFIGVANFVKVWTG